jgi:hypothetical protein
LIAEYQPQLKSSIQKQGNEEEGKNQEKELPSSRYDEDGYMLEESA